MNWYIEALKKYADFSGRSRRKEYWFFVLFGFLINIVLAVIDVKSGTLIRGAGLGLLGGLYVLATIVPSWAVAVRRLHDTNRTGWWLLIGFIPLIGTIVLIVFLASDSNSESNEYGPNPKLAQS